VGITLELAAHEEDVLARLHDDTTDTEIASLHFEEPADDDQYTAGRIWHVLHYLVSGDVGATSKPESFILSGGREVGPHDYYGRTRVLRSEECSAIVRALPDGDELARRLAQAAPLPDNVMYGDRIERGVADPDYVALYVGLKDFLARAARSERGVLISIIG